MTDDQCNTWALSIIDQLKNRNVSPHHMLVIFGDALVHIATEEDDNRDDWAAFLISIHDSWTISQEIKRQSEKEISKRKEDRQSDA